MSSHKQAAPLAKTLATTLVTTLATTVVIVDDQVMVASGLMAVLQTYPSIRPLAMAHRLDSARVIAAQLRPDVIILDYRLPDGLAPTAIPELRRLSGAAVVILSVSGDIAAVAAALAAGASGFLLKEQPVDELVSAITRAASGERVIAPALMGPLLDEVGNQTTRIEVTPRQRQILNLLANGAGTQQMAHDLHLSVNTLRKQIHATFGRLGAHSKLEAVAIARREHLLDAVAGLS